ncbi:DUF1176 domain-containing protein [Salmonella enterica subsp. enterica]|nr:DUF1176 domain-containing protein [Salmonella enterica]EEH0654983.1 DUF1176 domain-containing protein [Salmonella enterica subsp. enterica serovar Windermere]HCB5025130.1 DUF1176 domain-containing protein [Salmonella enterica subsp. enterica serovar Bredeney]HCB5301629.1 DUF1176 domain-containing protein [Salmonella enterica subsp. enterica serovar Overschie]HCB5310644.1 DUF1176 domain-containing protein [Salmonella enterica subsp. enterica serovar Overschie]
MKNGVRTGLLALTILSAPLMAQESGASFSHKDWEVVCDNTLTCRAAGYSSEEGTGGSVLLTRQAGAGTAVSGKVMLSEIDAESDAQVPRLTLWINDQLVGEVKSGKDGDGLLSDKQSRDIIAAVKGSGKVEFKGGPDPFVLSGEGAYAVLLKMDDVQGRIGTPGALTKKGDKPESRVKAAVPAPVIHQVKTEKAQERPLTAPELAVLKPKLLATLSKDDWCDRIQPSEEQEAETISLTPLDNAHSLISALCWRAAYNEGYGYWMVDSKLAGKPELITVSGSDYGDGVIFMSQKGRGLGDCWGSASWVWDGETFRKSREATTGMCRYLRPGGTWDLPTWVTDVKPAK